MATSTDQEIPNFLNESAYSLENWLETHLQPTQEFNRYSKDVIDRLINFLQHNSPYSIKRVIKSGSFGKGTQVKGSSDLDCVMVLNEIKDVSDLKHRIHDILQELQKLLKRSTWANNIRVEKISRFAVQFDVTVRTEKLSVDLLPTFDLLGENPTRGLKDQTFQQMLTSMKGDDAEYYSVAASQLQIDFVGRQTARLKNLIRLIKHWRKSVVLPQWKGGRYPTSYPLELITIHVWEKAGRSSSFDMAVGFRAVLQQLVSYRALNVIWYDHYGKSIADQVTSKMQRPILLDPANPTNNVMLASSTEAWDHVSRIASDTITKPLLRNVRVPPIW